MPSPLDVAVLTLGAITFRDRPFQDIVRAASASRFDAIGLTVGQCVSALERGIAAEELRDAVVEHGLRLAEFELVRLAAPAPVRGINEAAIELARALRPQRVHVAAFDGTPAQILDSFTDVCRLLPDVPVALEFMPYSSVRTLAEATRLAEETGQANARVVLDVLHFYRSGGAVEELSAAALSRVACLQLSDVRDRADVTLIDEARHMRTFPGEGELDLTALVTAVVELTGQVPPITVEPISDALERMPLHWVAEEAMRSTRGILQAAG